MRFPPFEYTNTPSVPTLIFEISFIVTEEEAPLTYTPIPLSPAEIFAEVPIVIFEPLSATSPIDVSPFPTPIVPLTVPLVPLANTPILSAPKEIVPIFKGAPVTFSNITPVLLDAPASEVILFDTIPVIAPLIYAPIPPVPVIFILSFCIDKAVPLLEE